MNNLGARGELWAERGFCGRGGKPLCDVCGKPLTYLDCDVHHAVVRKGIVRGAWPDELLDYPVNLCLVHRACHSQAHANPDLLVAIQIVRYGMNTLKQWITSLPFKAPYHWHRGLDERTARLVVERRAPWVRPSN